MVFQHVLRYEAQITGTAGELAVLLGYFPLEGLLVPGVNPPVLAVGCLAPQDFVTKLTPEVSLLHGLLHVLLHGLPVDFIEVELSEVVGEELEAALTALVL